MRPFSTPATVVLVTGGGGGIGAGIAEAFAEKGAKVAVTDINPDYAKAEAARIGHGTIALPFKPLEEVTSEEFARVMAINVTGVFNGCKAFIPEMKARGSGHIVNTSSVNGQIPFETFAAYSASKFAVSGLSEAIRVELAPFGVGVSILYPGLTRSRMSEGQVPGLSPEAAKTLAARMMEPVWLGRAVVRAVENNELHIITHPDHRPWLEARIEALYAAYGKPAQPRYGGGAISLD